MTKLLQSAHQLMLLPTNSKAVSNGILLDVNLLVGVEDRGHDHEVYLLSLELHSVYKAVRTIQQMQRARYK